MDRSFPLGETERLATIDFNRAVGFNARIDRPQP
jgi:hypothetical protein